MTNNQLTREKVQWLHDAAEEAAAVGIKLTMNPNELLMFTSALLAAMDSEPVAYTYERNLGYIDRGRETAYLWGKQNTEVGDIALYRHAQPAPVITFYRDGIEAAAKWIDKQREAYDSEHGWSDPDTGAFEFGNDAQRGYSSTLEELAEGIRALHPNAGNSPAIPEGYVIVPMRLTAENGAKGVLSGEFSETQFVNCPECFGDDECETCDGSGRIEITVPVTWTTIKEIWAKGVEHFAAALQEVQVVSEKIEQLRKKIDRCDVCTEGARGGCGTCAFNGNL